MTPEALGYFMNNALEQECFRCLLYAYIYEKSRPSTQLTLICKLHDKTYFEQLILQKQVL